jgi:hypothetical protein
LRLYRGLTKPYRPDRETGRFDGTDFTDCPYTALQYATGSRGEVLVLEVEPGANARVSEQLWSDSHARRLMVWGRFDGRLAGIFPAKELRAEVRKKGIRAASREYKAYVLESFIDKSLRAQPSEGAAATVPSRSRPAQPARVRHRRPFNTSTVATDGRLVPWLAADGPLAYTPEEPPDRDYYFQYSWIVPGIFADKTNRRHHYYFGASYREQASELFAFWAAARQGDARRLAFCLGSVDSETVAAPVAVYSAPGTARWRGPACMFIQHGSYQIVEEKDQPLLESGEVMLYRGIGDADEFRFFQAGVETADGTTWRRYVQIQAELLSDSVRSFNSIHDRAKRCETAHIRDETWMSDDIAREQGLDIDADGLAGALWDASHQSFSLARHVAKNKFGPHYVAYKTPLDNIRLTTFFAGESEVRVVSPYRLTLLESHGCRAEAGAHHTSIVTV